MLSLAALTGFIKDPPPFLPALQSV